MEICLVFILSHSIIPCKSRDTYQTYLDKFRHSKATEEKYNSKWTALKKRYVVFYDREEKLKLTFIYIYIYIYKQILSFSKQTLNVSAKVRSVPSRRNTQDIITTCILFKKNRTSLLPWCWKSPATNYEEEQSNINNDMVKHCRAWKPNADGNTRNIKLLQMDRLETAQLEVVLVM